MKRLVRRARALALAFRGDFMVIDRWLWISGQLPARPVELVDAGCGSGVWVLLSAALGHKALGLTNDTDAITRCNTRAVSLNAPAARFELQDLRTLGERGDMQASCDVVLCSEVIEHLLDDQGLLCDLANLLRPGGTLLLTTPSSNYRPMSRADAGPFLPIEDGRHVRKGYSSQDLSSMVRAAGLEPELVQQCSGVLSQKSTWLLNLLATKVGYTVAWVLTLPLRPLPLIIDPLVRRLGLWPDYSICIRASRA